MTPREKTAAMPPLHSVSPLGQAVMESFNGGLVLFDGYGRLVYANDVARRAAGIEADATAHRPGDLRPRPAPLGAGVTLLHFVATRHGEVVFLQRAEQTPTLA